jgi:alpha-L-rhamnosidase
VHIAHAGAKLRARQRCWWQVRVRDQAGVWSDWSAPANWTMGLLEAGDWHARWIGTGESLPVTEPPQVCPNTLPDPWLRRAFTLEVAPVRATAFVASIGFHELYVNGTRVGDAVLVPNVTDHSKRARYVAYEIGHVLGQFEVDLPQGRTLRIVTDESWSTHPSPSRLLGSWHFRDFGGEHYDAGRELPGWAEPGGSEAGWHPAVTFSPQLTISADQAEPNVLAEEVHPVAVERAGDGYRFDFGRNFAGWVELAIAGQPGDRIELQTSERANQAMCYGQRSTYVVGPTGRGVFRHRFNYAAGRWLQVQGLRQTPVLNDLRGWVVRPAFARASGFECASPRLNAIRATALWTLENLTLGGYIVDCPHRERMGYGGDAYATTTTGLGAYRLGAFFTKWAEDWRDVQDSRPSWGINVPAGEPGSGGREAGNFPYTAPTHWGGGGPAWSGYGVCLPWEIYRHYGDEEIVRRSLPMVERWLAFLETKTAGGLLVRYGGNWDFLGDWMWPGTDGTSTNGDTPAALCFNNCFWIHNLQLGSAMARIAGRHDLAAAWSRRADEVRQAVHARFFNAADASYVDGSQASLAMVLLAAVPPPKLRPAVWQRLEREIREVRGGHIHAGITGGSFLFQVLMTAGRDDLICLMVDRDDPPGWGAMLQRGATTFWESWEENPDSRLHSSFLFVGAWFVHGVLGIQPHPEHPGFQHFVIRPGVTDHPSLTWARGHYDSIHGRIAVAWRQEGGVFHLEAQVPPNTRARLELPAARVEDVTEEGRPAAQCDGVLSAATGTERVVLQLASGTYRFACEYRLAAASR